MREFCQTKALLKLLGSYLMIIGEVACLTHAHRVEESIVMWTVPRILIATILPVAARAHILRVVFSVHMWTLCYEHNFLRGVCLLFIFI